MDEHWFTFALKYLQRRPRSVFEVRQYLQKKNVPDISIDSIISVLEEKRFLNDVDFATWWIDQRTRFKPKGKRLIVSELQQKGVSKEVITQVYEAGDPEPMISDLEKAKELLIRKKEKFIALSRQERYQKAGSFLARRGFSMEVISKSIDEIFEK